MVLLKYDIMTAIQAGYPGHPTEVMKELGYEDLFYRTDLSSSNSIFIEVDQAIEPLPPFLEKSNVVDGRFDPRITEKRIVPAPIDLGDKMVHFHQDPMVFMTVDFGPKGGSASGDVKGGKASE